MIFLPWLGTHITAARDNEVENDSSWCGAPGRKTDSSLMGGKRLTACNDKVRDGDDDDDRFFRHN